MTKLQQLETLADLLVERLADQANPLSFEGWKEIRAALQECENLIEKMSK